MSAMTGGVTKAGTGIDGISWNILGQTYVPKQLSENSFAWHATFPPGTFVPPHIHPTQEEFIYMLDGRFDPHGPPVVTVMDASGVAALGRLALHTGDGRQVRRTFIRPRTSSSTCSRAAWTLCSKVTIPSRPPAM